MKMSSVDYPEPLMVIKPDLQTNELFNESELKTLRQELKFFTEEELQGAIFQAQAEINAELINKHTAINKNPPKNVKIQTINKNPPNKSRKNGAILSQPEQQIVQHNQQLKQHNGSHQQLKLNNGSHQQLKQDNVSQQQLKQNNVSHQQLKQNNVSHQQLKQNNVSHQQLKQEERIHRNLSNSSVESRSVVIEEDDNFGYDDDFDDSNQEEEEEISENEGDQSQEDTNNEEDSSSGESSNHQEHNNKNSATTNPKNSNGAKTSPTRHNIIDETLNQLFDDRTEHINPHAYDYSQLPVVENPQFCEQADLDQISMMLDTINTTFEQLFQCVHVNKADLLDDLEVERSNKRSKEFESRFNRANYQLERDMRALNKISRVCADFIDVVKLKGLLRSCARVLEMILHYIPLSGGAFFPHRIQIFIEILVDCGTLVTRLNVSTCSSQLAQVARNLRKLDFMVIKYEKDKLEISSHGIKNSTKSTRQSQGLHTHRPASAGVPKNCNNKSNMARLRKLRPDQGQFKLARARSYSKLNTAKQSKPVSNDTTSPYSPSKNGAKLKRAKSADVTNQAMSSLHNNTLHQISFEDFVAEDHDKELDASSNKAVGIQCSQSTNVQGVQSVQAVHKDKGVQQGEPSRSMSRNSGLLSMDLPLTSRYDEFASMDRVLSRIHNLELLALRQTTSSRNSQHTSYQTKSNIQHTSYQTKPNQYQYQSINQYNNPTNRTLDTTNHQNISHLYNNSNDNNDEIQPKNIKYTETMHTVNSLNNGTTDDTMNSSNAGNKKSGKINTSSLITRLEMMKSDFLLMEQKYC